MTTAEEDMNGEPGEIEMLLPWYATGKLSADEARRVETALDADPLLRAHLRRIEAEQAETIAGAEAMPRLSRAGEERLLADFASHSRLAKSSLLAGLLGRLGPAGFGFGALAAALVLLVVGGVIGHQIGAPGGGAYQTASGPESGLAEGSFVLIAFQADAKAAEIETLLASLGGSIVDGPRAGGLYRLRIGPAGMTEAETKAATDKLTLATAIVKLVIAAP